MSDKWRGYAKRRKSAIRRRIPPITTHRILELVRNRPLYSEIEHTNNTTAIPSQHPDGTTEKEGSYIAVIIVILPLEKSHGWHGGPLVEQNSRP
jgi:hypothetical protein